MSLSVVYALNIILCFVRRCGMSKAARSCFADLGSGLNRCDQLHASHHQHRDSVRAFVQMASWVIQED